MKRILKGAACILLTSAMATPAFADHTLSGFTRIQGILGYRTLADGGDPDRLVDMRHRAKWTNNINEYVSTVLFIEIDTPWGEAGSVPKGTTETGGKWGTDGVNIETKHLYVDLTIPNSPLAVRAGLQGFSDNFDSVLYNEDGAGLKLDFQMNTADFTLLWSKADEGTEPGEDDKDLYWAESNFKLSENGSAGVTLAWLRDQPKNADNYYLGLNGTFKVNQVDMSGWFIYNFGKDDAADADIAAYAAALTAKAKLQGGKVGGTVMYFSNDNDNEDDTSFNGFQGNNEFTKQGLLIFLQDGYKCNYSTGASHATVDAAQAGYGLLGFVANGQVDIESVAGGYFQGALGYFMALDDQVDDDPATKVEGTNLGFELAATFGFTVADVAEIKLRGAYAVLGSFYDNSAAGGKDPDDLYQAVLMLNVPY